MAYAVLPLYKFMMTSLRIQTNGISWFKQVLFIIFVILISSTKASEWKEGAQCQLTFDDQSAIANTTRPFRSISIRLNMEIKHYAEGSTQPPLQPDKIYLYSMRFCPYAHRAHLALNVKNVSYEPIFINLASKPKWYLDKFPAGRVPALWYKNELLYESLLLADFIDEEFPSNPLYPREPIKKLKDRMQIEKFNNVSGAFYKVAMVEFNSENFTALVNAVIEFEKELISRGTKYFGGEKPLMIDYMIWPWFERLDLLSILHGSEAKIPTEKIPNLVNWISLMKNDEAVKKHYAPAEVHAEHFRLRKLNDPRAFDLAVN